MEIFVETYNLIEGFHRWDGAPDACAYLRERHRHLFQIRCRFKVAALDREIEINMVQNAIEEYLVSEFGRPCEFSSMSCEMIAENLFARFTECNYCQVLEDGFGGATLTR